MHVGQPTSPLLLAGAGAALAILAYVVYQVSGLRLLRRRWQRLCELKAGQRQLYRDLEALQRRAAGLLARAPAAARPAPFAADDRRAIELATELRQQLTNARQGLRTLDGGTPPSENPFLLLTGHAWRRLKAIEAELRFGEEQRRAVASAHAVIGSLATVLAAIARKPHEVQQSLAELRAMAEVLGEDVAAEERRGTGGLMALTFEVQALRTSAMEWSQRLRSAGEAEAPQLAIEAEALRSQLTAKLWELLERTQEVTGVHDEALDWQGKFETALAAAAKDLAAQRPGFAEALQPAMRTLRQAQQTLAARYRQHDVEAYKEVAREAWALAARARALGAQVRRLGEVGRTAEQGYAACCQGLSELREEIDQEQRRSGVELDLCRALFAHAERSTASLQRVWADQIEAGCPADEATALAVLRKVEAVAAACREQQEACRRDLAAWQAQHKRIEAMLARLEGSAAEQRRLRRVWRDLQRFDHANWSQVETGWYDGYSAEKERILAEAGEVRATLAGGHAVQSGAGGLWRRLEDLERRWQTLLHEGQGLAMALRGVQAAERQVLEGVRALRPDVEQVAAKLEELPPEMPAAAELRSLCEQIVDTYRRLDEEARHPERANLLELRDGPLARLGEQLAAQRVGHERLLESERAALKRQMAALWARWEPLRQRLAKAAPASEVDRQVLQGRWEGLQRAARSPASSLRLVLELGAQAAALAKDVQQAEDQFQAEREATHQAEQRLAFQRHNAARLRERLPALLRRPHPQVVDEEWERSASAWTRAEALLRESAAQASVQPYIACLDEAATLCQEARARARSALVRLVRYAYLEDPEGMRVACGPLGRRWERLGVTAREQQIHDLLGELERAGQVEQLLERIGAHFSRPGQ